MAGISPENFQEEIELSKIRQNPSLNPLVRQSMIEETKKSFYNKKRNSSFKTILNISNNMIGTSILIFPLVFLNYGLINSIIILVIMAYISCEMCLLENRHVKMDEMDLPESIRRILGVKWFYSFVISSFVFNAFIVIIYFSLMTHIFYSMLEFFFVDGRESPLIASGSEITFSQFSIQYAEIIWAVIMFFLFSISNLKYLLIFCQYGILGIFIFVIFLFYKSIENMTSDKFSIQKLNLLTTDISTVAGVFSLAFFCHNNLITIVKTNKYPEKNSRDITISYMLTGGLYLLIGVLGCFSIVGLEIDAKPQLVLDYFKDSIFTILIEFLIFFQMVSVSPLNWFIGKSQIFELIYENRPTPKAAVILTNLLFVIISLIISILKIDLAFMISMNGAICGYVMLYIIPIKLHLDCLYEIHYESGDEVFYEGKMLMNHYDMKYFSVDSPATLKKNRIDDQREKELIDNLKMSKLGGLDIEGKRHCKSAHLTMIKSTPKLSRYLFYGFIAFVGGLIAILEVIEIIKGNY